MAITLTKVQNSDMLFGNKYGSIWDCKGDSSYATGGYVINAVDVGFKYLFGGVLVGANGVGSTYDAVWIPTSVNSAVGVTGGKLRLNRNAGFTPAGTLGSVNVTVTGGQGAGAALQINPDSASGVLGKTTATTFAIPQATFGIPVAAFTGTAVAASLQVEVANAVDVSAATFRMLFIGF